ncbi:MAG: phosphoribosylamine--glycine ligase, partial [Chloroflexota bacterium]
VAPGNAGTAAISENLPVSATDIEGLARTAKEKGVELTVVGPEAPLAAGIVDRFQELGLPAFGPSRAAARIEASKAFAHDLMERHGIPCASGRVFTTYAEARSYLEQAPLPIVVKADGLAAGKGVTVAASREEALRALHDCMVARVFGPSGDVVVIEECLIGREVSVFAFTDGVHISPLVAACDYKRIGDGDRGPNTGGMGSYSPPEFWTPALAAEAMERIMRPTVRALAAEGCPYRGVLYGGLMLTEDGLKSLEFNCRLGDPETQVVLPRLETDLVEIVLATLEGRLDRLTIRWRDEACVGVVLASPGYPGDYPKGLPIEGLDCVGRDALVFHAGTRIENGRVVTDGGRVLTVAALGRDMASARQTAYEGVARIGFQGAQHRKDIALRAVEASPGGRSARKASPTV